AYTGSVAVWAITQAGQRANMESFQVFGAAGTHSGTPVTYALWGTHPGRLSGRPRRTAPLAISRRRPAGALAVLEAKLARSSRSTSGFPPNRRSRRHRPLRFPTRLSVSKNDDMLARGASGHQAAHTSLAESLELSLLAC